MRRKTLFFCIVILSASISYLYAEEAEEAATPIVVNGDKVQYDHANKKVTGIGNVSITYKDIKMTCERIVVDIDKKEGIAEGDITLYQEGNVFKADKAIYDFEGKTGHLVKGDMESPPWYGQAETIDKIDDKVYKLNTSFITTCEFKEPHYRVEAKTIRVYLGDRVTAWHVFFYAGEVPIMYAPYYNHPLEDNLPQVNVVPGRNKEWGTFLLSSWRYYFHPDSKGHVHLDWRSKRGHAEGFDYKYGLRKFGKGYFRFYYLHDREPDESVELGTEMPSKRWRIQLRHKWEMDENTFMAGEFHKLSDQNFIKDYFYKEEYELEDEPLSYVTLVGARDNYVLSVLYQPKVNDFFTVVERLPEVKMNIRTLKLFNHLNLYYSSESSIVKLNKKHAKDVGRHVTPTGNYDAARIDSYNELSHPLKLFGFLHVNPFVGARETFYSDDANGNDNVIRYVFNTGVDFYTRLYKIYDVETDFLNLDIHDIRHIIIPSVKYDYLRRPNLKPAELPQFDSLDSIRKTNKATLSIEHKLQTKRGQKDGARDTVDLVTFIAESNFIFRDDIGSENELEDYIRYDLEIRPYDWMYIGAEAQLQRREGHFDTASADLYVDESEDLQFGVGYRYEKHENSQVTAQASYHINRDDWKRHWAFKIYERYEIQEEIFQEQEYTIVKDLHCWSGEFTCRIQEQKDFTFWVIFRLKAFPDIPFFFRTSYRAPTPGKKEGISVSATGT
jgi:LPS-assembly protein